jgi:hypothetical protein
MRIGKTMPIREMGLPEQSIAHIILLIRLTKRSQKVSCGGGEGRHAVNFFIANQNSMIVSLWIDGLFRSEHLSCEIETLQHIGSKLIFDPVYFFIQ